MAGIKGAEISREQRGVIALSCSPSQVGENVSVCKILLTCESVRVEVTRMKERIQTWVDPTVKKALQKLADIEGRKLSNLVAVLLEECLEAKCQEWAKHRALPSIQNVERPRQSKKRRQWQEVEDMPLSPSESEGSKNITLTPS